mmetsp:Transcript_17903/g.58500  ORF Transcript_17903/g.58500 Transcript_17903/m.58500 type:complete len:374 (+) Transcript_17903:3-1124(+)
MLGLVLLSLLLAPSAGLSPGGTGRPFILRNRTASAPDSSSGVGCRDESGKPVDWWAALKFPNGFEYTYIDANYAAEHPSEASGFRKSTGTLADADNALGHTLAGIYTGDSGVGYFLYNDEDPDEVKHNSRGHTKGVVGLDKSGGFWLVHSTPRFPTFPSRGPYEGMQDFTKKYGQSFLCMSLDLAVLDSLAPQFQLTFPAIFESKMPDTLAKEVPGLVDVIGGAHETAPKSNVVPIVTKAGNRMFNSFAKNVKWDQELYEDLIAPFYASSLLVETWMNGRNPCPTYCPPQFSYGAVNIRELNVDGTDWKETQDHSKWAVSFDLSAADPRTKVACIGDINRQMSQATRGGGTVCFEDDLLWRSFSSFVTAHDTC